MGSFGLCRGGGVVRTMMKVSLVSDFQMLAGMC